MDFDPKPEEMPDPPRLARSLSTHRLLTFAMSSVGFLAGGGIGMYLMAAGSPYGQVAFFGLSLLGFMVVFLAFPAIVKPRCTVPACSGRMDFAGTPNQGAYRCRLCGHRESFHYQGD